MEDLIQPKAEIKIQNQPKMNPSIYLSEPKFTIHIRCDSKIGRLNDKSILSGPVSRFFELISFSSAKISYSIASVCSSFKNPTVSSKPSFINSRLDFCILSTWPFVFIWISYGSNYCLTLQIR